MGLPQSRVLNIPVILGTAREGRKSEAVAVYVLDELKKRSDVQTELIDVRDFLLSSTVPDDGQNPKAKKWRERIIEADGLILVAPEYNRGYPGELKLLLDCAYDEYEKKPVALCGVSSGNFGGYRMVGALQGTLIELGLVVVRTVTYFPRVQELLDADGKVRTGTNAERLSSMFAELMWYANVLTSGRKKE